MKYFLVEGTLTSKDRIEDSIMEEHVSYSKKVMEEGLFLMSGLKADMSGAIYVMKAEKQEQIEQYLLQEPFRVRGIQEYKIVEFMPHYINEKEVSH